MLLKFFDKASNSYAWGDDGGFDMRQIRWTEEDGFVVGRVNGPGDEPWGARTRIDEDVSSDHVARSRADVVMSAQRKIENAIRVSAAAWRASHGFPAPNEEQIRKHCQTVLADRW